MKRTLVLSILSLLLFSHPAVCQEHPAQEALAPYFEALEEGLSVEALEKLAPLDEEQKKLAGYLIYEYNRIADLNYINCCSNLKNTATALEMYSTDNNGEYPENLDELYPSYLVAAQSCPNSEMQPYKAELTSASYKLSCPASHTDAGLPAPFYDETNGLTEVAYEDREIKPWKLIEVVFLPAKDEWSASSPQIRTRLEREGQAREVEGHYYLSEEGEHPLIERVTVINKGGVQIVDSRETLRLIALSYGDDSEFLERFIREHYQAIGPAAAGIVFASLLTDPSHEKTRAQLKERYREG